MIKIKKRLESLVKYVEPYDKIMDVGCDHALLDIYLIQSGLINNIYVGDVNPNALENGKQNIEKYELESQITPILSFGIEKISDIDVDTLIISGMGSKTIIEILSSPNLNKIYKLILQSNNNHYELRKFLMQNQFIIIDEEVIEDGKKTYINIIAVKNDQKLQYEEEQLEFGPILTTKIQNLDYFHALHDSYITLAAHSKSEEFREKIRMLEKIIAELTKNL